MEQIKKGDFRKALRQFDRAFGHLLEQKTTTREIYRLFANKGAAMMALGDMAGRYFLECALRLNPHYDFARETLDRNDRELSRLGRSKEQGGALLGFLAPLVVRIAMRGTRAIKALGLENDPAHRYYLWLKPFGIRFSKHHALPTRRTRINLPPKRFAFAGKRLRR